MNKENIFDGYPSFVLDHRPFFSIIIPCYNSRKTLDTLLHSILLQEMEDDLEVILADDNSTESYQDIVDKYSSELSIRQIKTDYNFAPGNTRERGVSIAEGEWVCFADHDDEFIEETLPVIKQIILDSEEQYYAIANFLEIDPESGEVIKEMRCTRNWNHAKFYNLDNLWKAFNIHFKKDLLTHEDIYISSCINCVMNILNREPLYIDKFVYKWNNRPTTISREKYGDHSFLETFFLDYLLSTGYVYLDAYSSGAININYALDSAIEVLLYAYFYTQGFLFHHPVDYIKDNETYARNYLTSIKLCFNIDNDFIWTYTADNDAKMFMEVKACASIASGPYIETYTFMQWLNMLHTDIKPLMTMSEAMHK